MLILWGKKLILHEDITPAFHQLRQNFILTGKIDKAQLYRNFFVYLNDEISAFFFQTASLAHSQNSCMLVTFLISALNSQPSIFSYRNRPYHGFRRHLDGQAKRSEITMFVWEFNSKQLLPQLNFTQFLNRNVKILVRRLYSPSLKYVAWLEDAQLIFLIFHTFQLFINSS